MLGVLGEVRPEERRGVVCAFLTLLGMLASHTLLETARDALFLARLPASQLPWMYLAIAAVAFGLSQAPSSRLERAFGAYGLALLLLSSSAVTFFLWTLGAWRSPWMLYVLYTWSGFFGTITGIRFWLVLSEIYTVSQAKRVYRLIAVGSVLGAIAGSMIAAVVTMSVPAERLVLLSALLAALTGLGPALLLKQPQGGGSGANAGVSFREAVRVIGEHPYVRPLAGLVVSSTVAVTLADYLFKAAVARDIAPEHLAGFFSLVSVALNVLALLVQVFAVGPLLARAGVHRALWVLPALLIAGSTGLLVGGGLVAALLLKSADGSLRYSLNRTATELLYVPLSDVLRSRVKPFIDAAGQRGGQALASLLILTPVAFVPKTPFLVFCLIALSVLWIATAANLQRNYLDLFRSALREGAILTRMDLPGLDLGSLESLFSALNSQSDTEVIAAMDLLVEEDKERLIPALILYHPSKAVALHAFDIFVAAGRKDFVPIADRLLAQGDPEIRAAALRARTLVRPDEALLREATHDPSPIVSATAVVGLVSSDRLSEDARVSLDALLASQSPAAGSALARAISLRPSPVFEDTLLDLAEAPEPEVLVEVARAMAAVRSERFLPALLPMLAQREVRTSAQGALLAHGNPALSFLDRALGDHALPQELRRHLPRTLSLFPAADAAPALLSHLLPEPDGMVRFKILRALGRLRAASPETALDPPTLAQATAETLEAAFRLVHWRSTLEDGGRHHPERQTAGFSLLSTLLRDKEVHALERLFRLIGLQYGGEDFARIHRGVSSANAKVSAAGRELLENVIRPPLRGPLLALIGDAPVSERLAAAAPYYRPPPLDYDSLLDTIVGERSESLRCIACHHVAELGLVSFRPRLAEVYAREKGFFAARVIERALALLDAIGAEPQHA
jgi:AAA family ATP:ADP antiporter